MFWPAIRKYLPVASGRNRVLRSPFRKLSTISTDEASITVHSFSTTFPYIWLRDSCQSSTCIHPSTSQKLHRSSDISPNVRPAADGGVQVAEDGIRITWSDGHESMFDWPFLMRHSSPENLSAFHKHVRKKPWNRYAIQSENNLFMTYDSLKSKAGLLAAITQVLKYGLLFVCGVCNQETSDDKCELSVLAQLFGEIRTTFYGRLWDVMNKSNSKNIAYTSLDLGLHMDLLYFEHPPRYQLLHCLRNRVEGGTSVFVDGLHVAECLRSSHPANFSMLTQWPVAFQYINDGHHIHYSHPTIERSPLSHGAARDADIHYINYSPPFQAPLPLATPRSFYTAFRRFSQLLNDPDNTYTYTLKEGDTVIFDNRRLLHARTAFHDVEGEIQNKESVSNRWLKGCYLEADGMMDRARVLGAEIENGC